MPDLTDSIKRAPSITQRLKQWLVPATFCLWLAGLLF